MNRLLRSGVFTLTVDRQIDILSRLQRLQMLKQQIVIHGAGVVIVGFHPLFHSEMTLIFVIAIFRNNTDMLVADLITNFTIERAGN